MVKKILLNFTIILTIMILYMYIATIIFVLEQAKNNNNFS